MHKAPKKSPKNEDADYSRFDTGGGCESAEDAPENLPDAAHLRALGFVPPLDPVGKTGEILELQVVRLAPLNRQVVVCQKIGGGEPLRVLVADNTNFRPRLSNGKPMVLKARVEEDGKLRLVGAGPRNPGRW